MLFGLGQVLHVDNTPPKVSAKFYKADVQLVLLYGSKTWNLSTTALWRGWRGFIFARPNVWLRNISHIREGTKSRVGLPLIHRLAQGVQDAHHLALLTSEGRNFHGIWYWTDQTTTRVG